MAQKSKHGISDNIKYEDISFYSGTITNTGIKNFQMGVYLKSKDPDPGNKLVDVGTSRIFKDDDGFSEKITTYRMSNNSGKSKFLLKAFEFQSNILFLERSVNERK